MVVNIRFKPFKGLILHLNILRERPLFERGSKIVQSSHKKRMDQSTKIPIPFSPSRPRTHSTAWKSRTTFRQMCTVWFYWIRRGSPLRQQRQPAGKWANLHSENWRVITENPPKWALTYTTSTGRAPNQWVWEEQPLVLGAPCVRESGNHPGQKPSTTSLIRDILLQIKRSRGFWRRLT